MISALCAPLRPLHVRVRRCLARLAPAALLLTLLSLPSGTAAVGAAPLAPARAQLLPQPGSMVPDYPLQSKEFALIKEGEFFHLFWMRHDPTVVYDSTELDLGHAISRDLKNWTQLPSVLRTRPDHWDSFHIWAPTIIKQGDTFYMYYAGVTRVPYPWNLLQKIGLATSTDLLTWTQTDQPVLFGAKVPWAFADSSVFPGCQFRDPFAMPDPTTPGRTLIFYVATPASAMDQLIVGSAQTTDMLDVEDLGPLPATDSAHYWGWCESPHFLVHNGLYYLFVTTPGHHSILYRTTPSPLADSTQWSGTYSLFDAANQTPIADSWFGSEGLSIPGHDYLAVVNASGYRIDIYEIVWNATPPGFSLASPSVNSGVPGGGTVPGLSLSVIPRTGAGPGILFSASLPEAGAARVDLYDVGGRRVRTLYDAPMPAGETVVAWDGTSDGSAQAPGGIYFAALTTRLGRRVARVPFIR